MAGIERSGRLSFAFPIFRYVRRLTVFLSFASLMLSAVGSCAGFGGSVSGTVKDTSNAVVPSAMVEAANTDTGVRYRQATNGQGFYSFPDLPIGRYNLVIQKTGFKPYHRTGVRHRRGQRGHCGCRFGNWRTVAGGHRERELPSTRKRPTLS